MDTTMSVPLSVAQAATRASISTKTVRRWLTAGRLQASRGPDGAWLIDPDELDRAITAPGQSTDSPTLATGHGQVTSIVQDLLNRLEAQAERIGHLDAQLTSTRQQLAAAEVRLLALEAPTPAPDLRPVSGDSEHAVAEPIQSPPAPPPKRAWWRFWSASPV